MNKIDTSPEAIRELVNRDVRQSHDDYYSQVCKLHDALKMLLAIADEKACDRRRMDYIAEHTRCDPKIDGQHVWWSPRLHNLRGPTLRAAIDVAIGVEKS